MINDIQEEIRIWHARNFPGSTLPLAALVLSEETGEVSRAVTKMIQGIRGTKEEWEVELKKELGDVIIAALSLANHAGLNIEDVILSRWSDISSRDWTSDKIGQGI